MLPFFFWFVVLFAVFWHVDSVTNDDGSSHVCDVDSAGGERVFCLCMRCLVHMQVDVEAVLARVADPKNSGTRADYSKFHDDRSTWTGVALEGGPSTIDGNPTLASQANRDNKADVRGVVH